MKSKNNVIVLSILIVLITIVSVLSISYAYWARVIVGSNNNVISSSCLNVNYRELSDAISLNRVGPNYYSDNYYYFSVTNTCDIPVYTDINLDILEGTDLDSSNIQLFFEGFDLGETIINRDDNFWDFISEENNEHPLVEYGDWDHCTLNQLENTNTTLNDAIYSKKLFSHKLEPGVNYYFALDTKLDYYAPFEESMEKTWNGKVVINSTTPSASYKVNFDANGGSVDVSSKYVYPSDIYGELPTPTREGYIFKYWYLEDESNGISNTSLVITNSDHTLKAKWVDKSNKSILKDHSFENTKNLNASAILPYRGYLSSEDINTLLNANMDDDNRFAWEVSKENSLYKTYFIYDCDSEILYYYSDGDIYITSERFGGGGSDWFNGYSPYEMDLSLINTSLVTDMSYMFSGCSRLKSLNISNFDTSSVTNMSYMFASCQSLVSLDLVNLNTSNVTNMYGMFSCCYELLSLNLTIFDTSNVTNMAYMFRFCEDLTSLDLSSFDTSNVSDMNGMFEGCYKLTNLNLSSFNTSNVTDMGDMFYDCNNLTALDLSSFDIGNGTYMNLLFDNCYLLTTINLDCSKGEALKNYIDNNYDTIRVTCV